MLLVLPEMRDNVNHAVTNASFLLSSTTSHHFSRKGDGSIGKFVRKTGDFTSKLGRSIQREWKEASEDFRE